MTVPTPKTWLAAETVDAPEANTELRDVFNFLLNPSHCYAYKISNQAWGNGSWAVVALDGELYDWSVTPMHSTVTNNTRVIAPDPGVYFAIAGVQFDAGVALTTRQVQLRKNAAGNPTSGTRVAINALPSLGGGVATIFGVTADVQLNAADYLELFAYKDTGAADADVMGGAAATFLSMRWSSKL